MKSRIPAMLLGAAALALTLASCTETKDVLVAKPLFTDPPTAAQDFIGYSDTVAKLPVCGNCHVAKYDSWKGTKHANAWADLQASGHATSSCEGCHTVNANGNYVDGDAGYTSTGDARYYDVQCETCHGPGLDHVENPSIQTEPLASIVVGVGLTNGCGECHSGNHNGFVDEWALSMHSDTTNHGITHREASCDVCHAARGVLDAWGVNTNYLEKNTDQLIPITCAVCHDPHDATNKYQLRFPIDVRDVNQNLCMKCHQYDAEPNPASPYGPMSPQGPMLLGQAGWRAPDFMPSTDAIYGTHGSDANTELCATCHMYKFAVNDSTGAMTWNYQGHEFQATPCLDSKTGMPEATSNCDMQQRDFDACATSGCHGSAGAARSAYETAETRISDLATQLNALVAQAPASEFVVGDGHITTAEGSKFNVELANMEGSAIHNPFLMEQLLTASIKQMEKDYGLQAAPGLKLDNMLQAGHLR
jgi:predicted CXXCH cytochrome family protein